MKTPEEKLLALCERKRAIDDSLGRCSDHEGQGDGPTYAMFKEMEEGPYVKTLDFYIGEHQKAVRVLRALMKLKSCALPPRKAGGRKV